MSSMQNSFSSTPSVKGNFQFYELSCKTVLPELVIQPIFLVPIQLNDINSYSGALLQNGYSIS